MAEIPNVCLTLSSSPESLAVVHEALTGVAVALELDALETDDLRTAAAEACKNVVYHAYEGEEGSLEVEVYALAGAVEILVRDHGIGIRPHVGERTQPHTGIGMPIVHVLSQRVTYSNLAGGGTEVRMHLAMPNAIALPPAQALAASQPRSVSECEPENTVEIALAPGSLAPVVLRRALSALAARAGLSAACAAAVAHLGEALAESACESLGASHLQVAVELATRGLELSVGPLRAGSAQGVLEAITPGPAAPGQPLLEEHRITPRDGGELLLLRLSERD